MCSAGPFTNVATAVPELLSKVLPKSEIGLVQWSFPWMRQPRSLITMSAVLAALCSSACGGGGEKGPPTESARIASIAIAAPVGPSEAGSDLQVTASVIATDGRPMENASLTWRSSDPSVVSVTSTGGRSIVAHSVGPVGVAEITASSGSVVSNAVTVSVVHAAATKVAATAGADQKTVVVGHEAGELRARVTDRFGNGVEGVVVAWRVSVGGGALLEGTSSTSGIDGLTMNRYRTATSAGDSQVSATIEGGSTAAEFLVTAIADLPASIEKVGVNPPEVLPLHTVGDSIRVMVRDQYRNPVSSAHVQFTVDAGGGSVAPATAVTDSLGLAASQFTTGSEAEVENRVSVRVAGAPASPAVFTARTARPKPTTLILASHVKLMETGESLDLPGIEVLDQSGTPIPEAPFSLASRTPTVATVNTSGSVTAVASGQTMIVVQSQENASAADSLLVIVGSAGGPVLMPDLTRFELRPDTSITVAVVFDLRASAARLGSAEVEVSWDPAQLTFLGYASAPGGPSATINETAVTTGELRLALGDATGFGGRVELIRLNFRASSTSGTVGALRLTVTEATAAVTFVDLTAASIGVAFPLVIR